MNACHLLDAMSWLVASDVAEVAGCTASKAAGRDVEDSLSMTYRYLSGAIGSLDATTRLVGPGVFEQVVQGSEGQLVVAPSLRLWSQRTVDGYERERWHTVLDLPLSSERLLFFESFADAVLDGRPPLVTAREARAVQASIEAAYLAADRKTAIPVATR
jgi:predicted dehydrogenase